ncbi:MAG: vWA domain-containing protein [Planctomycetota bacterium]
MTRIRNTRCLLVVAIFGLLALAAPASGQQRRGQPQLEPLKDLIQRFNAEKAQPYAKRYPILTKIGQHRTDEAAVFLDGVYKGDTDLNIRRMALSSLASVGTPKAREALDVAARTEGDPTLRAAALDGRARLKPLPDRALYEAAAAADQQPTVRMAGVRGIGAYRDKESVTLLISMLVAPPDGATQAVNPNARQLNRTIRDQLMRGEPKVTVDTIVELVLSKPAGRELWLKRELLPLCASTDELARHEEVVVKLTKERDAVVRATATASLETFPCGEEAQKRLIELIGDKDEGVAIAAIVAVDTHAPEAGLKALLKVAKKKNSPRAPAALSALGAYPESKEAFKLLGKMLKGRTNPWPIKAAALSAFSRIRTKASIEVLLEAIEKLEGRLLQDATRALAKLSGLDLGMDVVAWKDWWKAVHDSFELPPPGAKVKRSGGRGAATVSRNPTYYGQEIASKRLCFIVDLSGSMNATMKTAEGGEVTRMERAKTELLKVVGGLDKDAWFNLIFFGPGFKPWKETLVKALPKVRDEAKVHITRAPGMGGTNIFDPLEAALLDRNVDTIYLLSDGSPGSGKFVRPEDIRREVKRLNASRRVNIHTIVFGMKSPFMKGLAQDNGGNYIER